jgi:hypothetical protein
MGECLSFGVHDERATRWRKGKLPVHFNDYQTLNIWSSVQNAELLKFPDRKSISFAVAPTTQIAPAGA